MNWLNGLVQEHCSGGTGGRSGVPHNQNQLLWQGQGQGGGGGYAPAPAQSLFRQPPAAHAQAPPAAHGGNNRQVVFLGRGGGGVPRFLNHQNINSNNNSNGNLVNDVLNRIDPRVSQLYLNLFSQRLAGQANMAHQGSGLAVNNNRNKNLPVEIPLPPPVENLKMLELPFYEVERALDPIYLAPNAPNQAAQRMTFEVNLTELEQERFQYENRSHATPNQRGRQYHLVLRFCCLAKGLLEQVDKFPTNVKLYINNSQVQLPQAIPTVLSRQVKLVTPPAPLEVTNKLSFPPQHNVCRRHTITVHWAREEYKPDQFYYVFPFVVRKSTALFLTEKLKLESRFSKESTCNLIRSILGASGGCVSADICAPESLKVSLDCPIGKIRMTKPCRSTKCRHVQCFDTLNFLQMYEKVGIPKLVCPVCNVPVKVQDLKIDEYFLDILRCLSIMDTGSVIEIFADCRWKSAEITQKKNYDRTTIDITEEGDLIEDDDEKKAAEEVTYGRAIPLPPAPAPAPVISNVNSSNPSQVWPIFRRSSNSIIDNAASSTPNTSTGRPQAPRPCPSSSGSPPELVDLCDSILEDNEPAAPPPPPSRPPQRPSLRSTQNPGFVPLVINAPNLLSAFSGQRPPRLNFTRSSPPNFVPGQSAPARTPVTVTLEEDGIANGAATASVGIDMQETLPITDASPPPAPPPMVTQSEPTPTSSSSSLVPQLQTQTQTLVRRNKVAVVENGDAGAGASKVKKARKETKSKPKANEKEAAAEKPAKTKKPKNRAQKEKEDSPPPPQFEEPQDQAPVRRSGRNANKRVNYGKFFDSISE